MRRSVTILAAVALSTSFVVGGRGGGDPAWAATPADNVVGSWQLALTDAAAAEGATPTPALATFFADGAFITSDLPVMPVPSPDASPDASPAPPDVLLTLLHLTAGQGVWTATGSGRAAVTFVELATDDTGAFVAVFTVTASLRLDDTGNGLAGPYSVSMAAPDGTPLGTSDGTLTGTRIRIALIADFTGSQDPGTLDISFLDKSTGAPSGWAWDFGDGRRASRQNPTHTYAEAGEYEVTLTTRDAEGTSDKTRTITVDPVPAPVADFTREQPVGTLDVKFTDASTGDATTWAWDFGDGRTSDRPNPAHSYAKAGDYPVKLTVRNAGGADSHKATVTVKPAPALTADFTVVGDPGTFDVHFTDTSKGTPTAWSWSFGDGRANDNQNPNHRYTDAGEYEVKLTVKNAGGSDSRTMKVTVGPATSPSPA